ncbi:hypothetical protein [Aquimarina litoralis]|uniref:hypothetical protein n=1 Tax=Aquimarina litoralis TaxID=584605 RepID=UPI001C58FCDF|nr:hypothetical protein [Aquimarina litoralis]MBW1294175.1 hypothetical protein [Aquimarina litoralis]
MKVIYKAAIILSILTTIISCGSFGDEYTSDKKGFSAIEKEVKDKFGSNAYFTELSITHNIAIGNIVGVTVTEAPESLKMGQWNLIQATWKQNSEISLEVPQGRKAAEFMFQLNDKINLVKLGELVEKSSIQLQDEKDIKNPLLNIAFIKFPKNGDTSKAEYHVNLKPENGDTNFRFNYDLHGNLIEMDY